MRAFESAEAGKKEERDHEINHHDRGGMFFAVDSTRRRSQTEKESGSVQIIIRPELHQNRHRLDTITVGKKENTTRIGCSASYLPSFGRVRSV